MNAAQYEEMLSLLNDIAARLDRLEQRLGPDGAAQASPSGGVDRLNDSGPSEGTAAEARDLEGPYGNPEIRRDPPRWTGQSYVGCRFSEASAEYLETLAGFLDWKARESDKKDERVKGGALKSKFIRLDAARARGWRKRILEGGHKRPASTGQGASFGKPSQTPTPGPAAARDNVEMDYDADMPF
jgi:hypothetical protein